MYRIRVRSNRRPAPIHGILLVGTLLTVIWLSTRPPHAAVSPRGLRPHASTGFAAASTQPYLPAAAIPKPAPSRLPFTLGEPSGILWNLNTHQLLWALQPNLPGGLASTTKLMTFYLAYHRLPLSKVVTISLKAAATPGSDIFMQAGQHYTVRQLLYALLMASANDASVALAQATAHHTARFVQLMNRTARQLGMTQTHYGDPDGLSPASYGTAWNLSTIVEQDMKIPLFRRIVDTRVTSLPHNPVVSNLNGLLRLDPSVIGVKTGWTTASGFSVIFAAKQTVDGHPVTLLGILMHGQDGFYPVYTDAEKLLNWGFSQVRQASPASHAWLPIRHHARHT